MESPYRKTLLRLAVLCNVMGIALLMAFVISLQGPRVRQARPRSAHSRVSHQAATNAPLWSWSPAVAGTHVYGPFLPSGFAAEAPASTEEKAATECQEETGTDGNSEVPPPNLPRPEIPPPFPPSLLPMPVADLQKAAPEAEKLPSLEVTIPASFFASTPQAAEIAASLGQQLSSQGYLATVVVTDQQAVPTVKTHRAAEAPASASPTPPLVPPDERGVPVAGLPFPENPAQRVAWPGGRSRTLRDAPGRASGMAFPFRQPGAVEGSRKLAQLPAAITPPWRQPGGAVDPGKWKGPMSASPAPGAGTQGSASLQVSLPVELFANEQQATAMAVSLGHQLSRQGCLTTVVVTDPPQIDSALRSDRSKERPPDAPVFQKEDSPVPDERNPEPPLQGVRTAAAQFLRSHRQTSAAGPVVGRKTSLVSERRVAAPSTATGVPPSVGTSAVRTPVTKVTKGRPKAIRLAALPGEGAGKEVSEVPPTTSAIQPGNARIARVPRSRDADSLGSSVASISEGPVVAVDPPAIAPSGPQTHGVRMAQGSGKGRRFSLTGGKETPSDAPALAEEETLSLETPGEGDCPSGVKAVAERILRVWYPDERDPLPAKPEIRIASWSPQAIPALPEPGMLGIKPRNLPFSPSPPQPLGLHGRWIAAGAAPLLSASVGLEALGGSWAETLEPRFEVPPRVLAAAQSFSLFPVPPISLRPSLLISPGLVSEGEPTASNPPGDPPADPAVEPSSPVEDSAELPKPPVRIALATEMPRPPMAIPWEIPRDAPGLMLKRLAAFGGCAITASQEAMRAATVRLERAWRPAVQARRKTRGPAPSPAPAPPLAGLDSSGSPKVYQVLPAFEVQVVEGENPVEAQLIRQNLREQGFPCHLRDLSTVGLQRYILWVGPYAELSAAESQERTLKKQGFQARINPTVDYRLMESTGTDLYAVQIASFREAVGTERMQQSLVDEGAPTLLQRDEATGFTRVCIGPFASRKMAQQAADHLHGTGYPTWIIKLEDTR